MICSDYKVFSSCNLARDTDLNIDDLKMGITFHQRILLSRLMKIGVLRLFLLYPRFDTGKERKESWEGGSLVLCIGLLGHQRLNPKFIGCPVKIDYNGRVMAPGL